MTSGATPFRPRVDLHVHLLGAVSDATIARLAARHPGAALHGLDAAGVRARRRFHDLASFIAAWLPLCEVVLGAEDVVDATRDAAAGFARAGVRYAEVRFTPVSHVRRGAIESDLLAGLHAGRLVARLEHGVEIAWVLDVPRDLGAVAAMDTARLAAQAAPRDVVAIDFVGSEHALRPGDHAPFAPAADAARAAGLHVVAHAGEAAGPWSVAEALDVLGAERIGHGTRAIEDPALVERLARERIPLEVCPTSNVRLGVVPSIAAHPVGELLRRGLVIALGSDDPVLFDCDLPGEYAEVAAAFGLDGGALRALERAAIDAAFLDDAERERLFPA